MTSILREVCRERLNQEWAQADKSLDNYKNVMSKESKLIDEGEIRKNILDKAANKILALPFQEQAVFHIYYAFRIGLIFERTLLLYLLKNQKRLLLPLRNRYEYVRYQKFPLRTAC